MTEGSISLSKIFDGWDGLQTSILHAVQPLTPEQLAWRAAPNLRSVGEVVSHIALGRVDWFERMQAPGSAALAARIAALGPQLAVEASIAGDRDVLLEWLEASWGMIADTLNQWTVSDLARTYRHEYWGKALRRLVPVDHLAHPDPRYAPRRRAGADAGHAADPRPRAGRPVWASHRAAA